MDLQARLIERFEELEVMGEEVLRRRRRGEFVSHIYDDRLAYEWRAAGVSFLQRVFGDDSTQVRLFEEPFASMNTSSGRPLDRSLGVLIAARGEVAGGYLFNTRALIEAEVFSDFLEQAEHLLENGYHQAAAVIAGGVLEDSIRKLCERNNIEMPEKATIDPMNTELAKAGVYSKLEQKRVTALADIRNHAAHARWERFQKEDVEDMLRQVTRFVADYSS